MYCKFGQFNQIIKLIFRQKYLKGPALGMYTTCKDDVVISAFPMFHIAGIMVGYFRMLVHGATCVVFDQYNTNMYLKALKKYRVSVI